ncbi:MAG: hypothetical protein WCX65_07375 [bacterium]
MKNIKIILLVIFFASLLGAPGAAQTPAAGKPHEKQTAKAAKQTEETIFKTPAELEMEAAAQEREGVEPQVQLETGTVAIPASASELLPATAAQQIPQPKEKIVKPAPAPVLKPKKSPPAQVDFEKEEKEPEKPAEEVKKTAEGIEKLNVAVPGKIEYFDINMPVGPILGLTVLELNDSGALGIAILTGSSMEVFRFESSTKLKRVWRGAFKEKYPARGLAGNIKSGNFNGRPLIFVSMNPFKKAFAYEWKSGRFEKAGKASNLVVDAMANPALNIVSDFGPGVMTFAGRQTRIVDTTSVEPRSIAFPIPVDYYSGCVLRWSDISVNLTQVAVATEDGAINLYQGPQTLKASTEPMYGDAVACVPKVDGISRLIATTQSSDEDAVVLLDLNGNSIEERWRTPELGGAVSRIAPYDFDKDGATEIIGVINKRSGGAVLFRLLPMYSAPTPAQLKIAEEEKKAALKLKPKSSANQSRNVTSKRETRPEKPKDTPEVGKSGAVKK